MTERGERIPRLTDRLSGKIGSLYTEAYLAGERTGLKTAKAVGEVSEVVGKGWRRAADAVTLGLAPDLLDFVHDNSPLGMMADLRPAAEVFLNKKEVGVTSKTEVARYGLATLQHFESPVPKEQRRKEPLLLVFARMNRPEIIDFQKGKSFVEHANQQGYDVYMIDWGRVEENSPEEYKNVGLADDVFVNIPYFVEQMKKDKGGDKFVALGWCQGAELLTMYSATHPNDGLVAQDLLKC